VLLTDRWFLLLLLLLPVLYALSVRNGLGGSIRFPTLREARRFGEGFAVWFRRYFLPFMRMLTLGLIIFALARPQRGSEESIITTEGIDIVLTLDVSGSMRAEDFTLEGKRANRLAVVKSVVEDFIKARKNDRIGMVVFASYAYTQCPLTTDYRVLLEILKKVDFAPAGEEKTAIGSAEAASLNLLQDSKAKSKIIVLLTDGENNAGKIDPITAARIAQPLGVKIYTIGVGTTGYAPVPRMTPFGVQYVQVQVSLDEDTLRQIAETTGGKYFRATDTESLKKIYAEIDKLEKSKIEVTHYSDYEDVFPYFLLPAMGLLLFEVFLAGTRFGRIP